MIRLLPLATAVLALCACSDGVRPGAGAALAAAGPAQADDWPRAAAAAAASGDPLEIRLVAYLRALAGGASPAAIAGVLRDSPEFPNQAVLRARYGTALAADPDDGEVRGFCAATLPATPDGLARCADAERAAGDMGAATADARAAWRAGAARGEAAEMAFLAAYATALTADDRWARFTVLAAAGPAAAAAAGRAAGALDPAQRALAEARLALAAPDAAEPLALYDAVPAALRDDPPLVLAVARVLRRGGTDDAALRFWRAHGFAVEAAHPAAAFWAERDRLARALLASGDVRDALEVADDDAAPAPAARADALFLAGWIALRYSGDPALAAQRFERLGATSRSLSTRARASYWLGRVARMSGDDAAAHRSMTDAAAFPTTFYGQRAAALLGGASLERRLAGLAEPAPPQAAALAFAAAEMPRAALLLTAWSERVRARAFLDLADSEGGDADGGETTPVHHVLAARLALSLGLPEEAVTIARRAAREGIAMPVLGWPRPVEPPPSAVPPGLMLGLMRQESGFDTSAVSPSGALGLCQLLPRTAAELGRQENERVSPARLTTDPALNMRLGSAYLALLLRRADGIAPAAIASYNAGPHRVGTWPSAPDATLDDDRTIDWIEAIPVSETRNYVERVLENEAVYAASPRPAPGSAAAMLALAPHA